MISTGILFILGVDGWIGKIGGKEEMLLPWYAPFSIIIVGILCALPTMIFATEKELSKSSFRIRILLHFLLLFAIVSLAGYLFEWYRDVGDYVFVMSAFVVLYLLVWLGSVLLNRYDEALINRALEQMQDDE